MEHLSIATHHSNQKYYSGDRKSIFLAGPTTRNSKFGTDWRHDVRRILNNRSDLVLFIPEPIDLSNNPDCDIIPFWPDFNTQVEWELYHLSIANIILFWVPRTFPDHCGLTTNVEFGYWIRDSRTIYGRPDWAEKCKYLDYLWEYRKKSHPIFVDLHKMCQYILNFI